MSYYPDPEDALAIHRSAIRRYGGTLGVRDQGALESALARPRSGYYRDLIEETAALWESLSQNHPFLDVNKRTAVAVMAGFLRVNGIELEFQDIEAYRFLIHLYETGQLRATELDGWLRLHFSGPSSKAEVS